MTKLITFLKGFFEGKQSMSRLILLLSTLILFGTWSYVSIQKQELQKIDSQIVYAYAFVVGGKAVGKYFEVKPTSTPPTTI